MGSFKLGKMTLRSLFSTPETTCYPVVQKTAPAGRKGQIVNDIKTCILCGICDKTCPAAAITISKPDKTWTIDHFRCVTCGACVRACPKKCLEMDPTFIVPATKMEPFVMTKPEETEEEKAAKEAARQAKIAAAKAAKTGEAEGEKPKPVVPMTDEEIEAKVAKLDPEKQEKTRKALKAKQARDIAAAQAAKQD